MADDIVVLSDSDEENAKKIWKGKSVLITKNIGQQQQKNQHGKRKLQQNALADDEAPALKRPTYDSEKSLKSDDQRANCSTPNFPQTVAVETLATPSATPPLQLLASPPRNTSTSKEMLPLNRQSDLETVSVAAVDSPKSTKDQARRVLLTTVLNENDDAWQELRRKRLQALASGSNSPAELNSGDGASRSPLPHVLDLTHSPLNPRPKTQQVETKTDIKSNSAEKRPLEKEYEELISVCRKADPSADMQKLIDTKLLKYYYGVHPDFVKSRGFRKTVCNCIERIRAEPDLVYYNLKAVVDEMNVRRKSKNVIITNEEVSLNPGSSSNGTAAPAATPVLSKHTEEQIKKLNKALYVLKKRIYSLEQAEVNFDDKKSTYIQVEKCKKRACQIYEKICDLTGESKHARRLVKKPIQFSGTSYPVFNKTLQAYINRTREFPDFYDVLHMMEHCNKQCDLQLANFEMKRIAQDAFLQVGKILQSRRKTDLYETVSHFTADMEDPAKSDPELLAKLNENQKKQTRISDILETYARAQEDPIALEALRKEQEAQDKNEDKENGESEEVAEAAAVTNSKAANSSSTSEDESENDEDDDELEAQVEKLAKDNSIDISDDEVDVQISNDPTQQTTVLEKTNENDRNIDLKLTENNNNLSSKAIRSVEHEESTNTETLHKTTNVQTSDSEVKKDTVKTPPLTTTKTTAKEAKQLRTIAEIVISDEE